MSNKNKVATSTQTVKEAIKAVDDRKVKFEKLAMTAFRGGGSNQAFKLVNPQAYRGGSSQVRGIINAMIEINNTTGNPVIETEKLLAEIKEGNYIQTTQPIAKVVGHYRKMLADVGVYELV